MMRFTIIDDRGTVSFVAPPHALKALAAGCSRGVTTIKELLVLLEEYDAGLARDVRDGLAIFNEHATAEDATWVHDRLAQGDGAVGPITVIDDRTRDESLRPDRLGLVVFNLPARRIVQVQNSYANLERQDRGRVRRDGKPTSTFYSYALPDEWSIVP